MTRAELKAVRVAEIKRLIAAKAIATHKAGYDVKAMFETWKAGK